ncbi:hypothetical protein D3C78_1962690 [compost metagenome]
MAQMIRPSTGSRMINNTQTSFIPVLAPLLKTLMIAQISSTRMIRPTTLLKVEPM